MNMYEGSAAAHVRPNAAIRQRTRAQWQNGRESARPSANYRVTL